MKIKKIKPKTIKKLEIFYLFFTSFCAALYFKSGGVYANNIPVIFGQKEMLNKTNNVVVAKANNLSMPYTTPTKIVDPPKYNRFPWGQCTWYVATKRNVTWNGHARSWYRNAKAAGRPVGQVPKVGSIIVLNQGYYGHVGYVERVEGDNITYSESNNPRPGKITRQTVNYKTLPVIGFIY